MNDELSNLSGYLLLQGWSRSTAGAVLPNLPDLPRAGDYGRKNWYSYKFISQDPLLGEDRTILAPPFEYRILIYVTHNKLLFLGQNKSIADALLKRIKDSKERFFRVLIDTDLLTQVVANYFRSSDAASTYISRLSESVAIARKKLHSEYVVHSAYCSVPGALDEQLNFISFLGTDIGASEIFRHNLKSITCMQCGLKTKDRNTEVLVGSWGFVSMPTSPSEKELSKLEYFLDLLTDAGLILEASRRKV